MASYIMRTTLNIEHNCYDMSETSTFYYAVINKERSNPTSTSGWKLGNKCVKGKWHLTHLE